MKRLFLILLLIFPLSCYDGLSDMLDDVTMKVPVCVDSVNGSDMNDGRGWRNAKATILDAVDVARDGDEIWVAEGTYVLTWNIVIDKSIKIYGGFKGNESRVTKRDSKVNISRIESVPDWFEINSNVTVLFDGLTFTGFNDKVISIQSGAQVTTRDCKFIGNTGGGVINVLGSSYWAVNCEFIENTMAGGNGGSIYLSNSTAEIKNTIFDSNSANSGGAIYAANNSNLTISENTKFIKNEASSSNGGAIFFNGRNLLIEDSFFGSDEENRGNSATDSVNGGGGALYANNYSTIIRRTEFKNNKGRLGGAIRYSTTDKGIGEITSCTFDKNESTSQPGGAIFFEGTSDVELHITGSDFIRNKSAQRGGAINIAGGVSKNVIIKDTDFGSDVETEGNIGQSGGAINIEGPSFLTVINCDFKNNQTVDSYNGGAISAHGNSKVNISSGSLFFKNKAYNGGALYFEGSILEVSSTEFANNTSTGTAGGAVYVFSGNSSFMNSLFQENVVSGSSAFGGAVAVRSGPATISACRFISNEAPIDNIDSGGGAVFFNQTSKSIIVNSYFYNNRAYWGGAVYIGGDGWSKIDHAFVNLTFYSNSANITTGTGGAIFMMNVSDVFNSVFYGNNASSIENIDKYDLNGEPVNLYSCYFDGGMSVDITIDPSCINSLALPFASTVFGSSNFLYPSTGLGVNGLINNGMSDFADSLIVDHFIMPATDLAGNPRNVGGIDIGAYERQ